MPGLAQVVGAVTFIGMDANDGPIDGVTRVTA